MSDDVKSEGQGSFLALAAIAVGVLPGLWIFMGVLHQQSYIMRFGLPAGSLRLEALEYAIQGFQHSVFFLVGFISIAFTASQTWADARTQSSRPHVIFVLLAGAAVFAFTINLFQRLITDRVGLIRMEDLFAGAFALIVGVLVILRIMGREGRLGWTTSDSPVGYAVLGTSVILLAAAFSSAMGWEQATNEMWGRGSHYEIQIFTGPAEQMDNRTYLLVAHHEGRYYLRDMTALTAEAPVVLVVDSDVVHHVEIRLVRGTG